MYIYFFFEMRIFKNGGLCEFFVLDLGIVIEWLDSYWKAWVSIFVYLLGIWVLFSVVLGNMIKCYLFIIWIS